MFACHRFLLFKFGCYRISLSSSAQFLTDYCERVQAYVIRGLGDESGAFLCEGQHSQTSRVKCSQHGVFQFPFSARKAHFRKWYHLPLPQSFSVGLFSCRPLLRMTGT